MPRLAIDQTSRTDRTLSIQAWTDQCARVAGPLEKLVPTLMMPFHKQHMPLARET